MWNRRKKLSSRRVSPRHERRERRLRLEALERRDCPAVQAFFSAGVLTVLGDEGPNDIEFVQRSDGAVELLGDVERHTFEGVSKIVARTGGGDDRVSGKIILWVRNVDPNPSSNTVPFILDLDLGAGNDTARIEDDILITFRDLNDPRIRNLVTTHSMDVHVDLGTGTDGLVIEVEHHDIVNVDVNSADSFDSVKVGVQYPLPMPIRLTQARIATVNVNLEGGGHSVDVQTQEVDVVDLSVVVFAGRAPSDPTGNTIYISSSGGGVWKTAVEVGGDNNVLDLRADNIDDVDLDMLVVGDNNVVKHELGHSLGFRHEHTRPETTAQANLTLLGDGNDVEFNSNGHDVVGIDIRPTGNGNHVEIALSHPAVQKVREAAAQVSLEIEGSNNQGTVSNDGYADWRVNFGHTSSSSDPASDGTRQTTSFLVTFDRPIDPAQGTTPTGTVTFFVDGNPQVPGSDSFEVHGQGFGAATVDANTAGGNDSIWIDIDAPIMNVSVDTGSGDDTLVVDAQIAQPGRTDVSSVAVADINLGEGNDVADFKIEGYTDVSLHLNAVRADDVGQVDFDLLALSGSNTVEFVGEHTRDLVGIDYRPSCMIDLNFGGDDDNLVDTSTVGFDDVKLSITATSREPDVAAFALDLSFKNLEGNRQKGRSNAGVIWQPLFDPPSGFDPRNSHIVDIVASNYDSASINVATGEGEDRIAVTGSGLGAASVEADTGAGDDHVELNFVNDGNSPTPATVDAVLNLGEGNDTLSFMAEAASVNLEVHGGEGDDMIEIGDGESTSSPRTEQTRQVTLIVDMGTGADASTVNLHGADRVIVDVHSFEDGFDKVFISLENAHPGFLGGVRVAVADVNLEGDKNLVNVHTDGYDDVNVNGSFAGGDNQVDIGTVHLWVRDASVESMALVSLDFGGTNNQGHVSNQGFGVWEVNLGQAPTSESPDHSLHFSVKLRGNEAVLGDGSVRFVSQGISPTAPVGDIITIQGQGFGAATVDADTAGGNDSIWIDIDAPLQLDLATGDGDDDVRVDNQPERWFSEGPAPINLVSIDTGGGDDKVVVRAQAGEPFPFTRDGRSSGMVVDLGEGNDTADIETQGFFETSLELTGRAGDDTVNVVVLDNVTDVFERSRSAAIAIDSGAGNDNVTTRSNVFAVFLTVGFFEVTNNVKTGAGDDKVRIHNEGVGEDNTRVDTGEGNDTVEFDSRAGVGILKSTDGGATNLGTVTFTMTLGFGDDRAEINTIGYGELNGFVDAGDGDDTIISSDSPASPSATPKPVLIVIYSRTFYLGAGDDHLTIETLGAVTTNTFVDAGDGDDTIISKIGQTSAAGSYPGLYRLFGESTSDYDLGAGNDRLQVDDSGSRQAKLRIDAGDGNDSVKYKMLFAPLIVDLDGHARLDVETLLGAGDDRLEADTVGAGQANILINGGDGDDEIRTRHQWLAHLDRTQLNLVVMLGAGSDTAAIETAGYRRVKTAINTGPAGDGSDSVSASHQSQRRSSRKHNIRLNLDGGLDVYRHTSKGYRVQKTVQSAVSVEWVFVA